MSVFLTIYDFVSNNFLFIQDLIGTAVFAVSGVIVAREHNMDFFGMFILAFVTGVGGGTLRDMMLGATPVFWMKQPVYIYTVIFAVCLTILFYKIFKNSDFWLMFFDAIGLGVFTVIGAQKGLNFELHPVVAIGLGTVTGSFGGAIRDFLANEIPAILHKDLYATPCLIGGLVFVILRHYGVDSNWVDVCTVCFVVGVRVLSVRYHWQLPKCVRE